MLVGIPYKCNFNNARDSYSAERTNDAFKTIVARYWFPVVTSPSFKGFGKIDSILARLSLEVEFMYATLSYH